MCVIDNARISWKVVVVAKIVADIVVIGKGTIIAWWQGTATIGNFTDGDGKLHHAICVAGLNFRFRDNKPLYDPTLIKEIEWIVIAGYIICGF